MSLTKLNNAKKCVFVEGEDIKILQQFYNVLYPESIYSLDIVPSLPLGGFKRINEAFGAAKLFYESSEAQFKCYALLDRDYYLENQIEEIKKTANENHLLLHIWSKKELENYIIKPAVFFRLTQFPQEKFNDFMEKYELLIDSFKDSIIDAYTTKIQEESRALTAGTAAKQARDYVNKRWTTIDEKINILPGKDLLRATNTWIKNNYNISCSMKRIFNAMKPKDIDKEIVEILKQLIE